MKILSSRCGSDGFGLVEVLVTAVVIGVGFFSVAALQTALMDSNRTNKTRAEAVALASSKIEELRGDSAQDYEAIVSSGTPDAISGVTENFQRSWIVNPLTNPDRKELVVSVCWANGCGQEPLIEQTVHVQSVVTDDSMANTAKASGLDGGGSSDISPNAGSSDYITAVKKLSGNFSQEDEHSRVVQEGDQYYLVTRVLADGENGSALAVEVNVCSALVNLEDQENLKAFENNLRTARLDYERDESGNMEAINLYEVVELEGTEYCIPRVRFNGGVIIRLRGIVYSRATSGGTLLDVDLFSFNASESGAYCAFDPPEGATSAPYTCYVGGNCSDVICNESTCDDADVTKCPEFEFSIDSVGDGGWRGKIGLLGVAGTSSEYFNACFAEEVAGAFDSLDTAREYYTRRGNDNEGINKPYDCQDFVIVDGQPNDRKVAAECGNAVTVDLAGSTNVASKTIVRVIDSGGNLFDPVIDTSNCVGALPTEYVIAGPITGATETPTVTASDGETSVECTETLTDYSCTISSSQSAVVIKGIAGSTPATCTVSSLDPEVTEVIGCELSFVGAQTYVFSGVVTGSSEFDESEVLSLEVIDGEGNPAACTITASVAEISGTYECVITTDNTVGLIIDGTANPGFSVMPVSTTPIIGACIDTDGVMECGGGDFQISEIDPSETYTVGGNIVLESSVDNSEHEVGVSVQGGSCSVVLSGDWRSGSVGEYSCQFEGLPSDLTFSISPACSTTSGQGKGRSDKKYSLKADGDEALDGSLVIQLSVPDSEIDLRVHESTTDCGD